MSQAKMSTCYLHCILDFKHESCQAHHLHDDRIRPHRLEKVLEQHIIDGDLEIITTIRAVLSSPQEKYI